MAYEAAAVSEAAAVHEAAAASDAASVSEMAAVSELAAVYEAAAVYEVAAGPGLPRTARRFDLVFAGLFPWLTPLDDERPALPPHPLAPLPDLAAQAADSLLVRHASPELKSAARTRLAAGTTAEQDQLEVWARLLADALRNRVESEQKDRSYYLLQSPLEAIFPLTAHLMGVHLGEHPFPMLLPALPIAAATHDLTGPHDPDGALLRGVRAAMNTWATAGVTTPAFPEPETEIRAGTETGAGIGIGTETRAGAGIGIGELVTLFWRHDDASPDRATAAAHFLRQIPRQTLGMIMNSPPVQLTPLGAYGIRRLLLAHRWTISPTTPAP
ncbi:hypothetical protein ACGFI3_34990 [Nonomuraea wenchangensis]|uniref:hypothetical protein n=1 Tax=Nonomuraea wenchangensis TaxID=568860 RepID=UPI0037138DE8